MPTPAPRPGANWVKPGLFSPVPQFPPTPREAGSRSLLWAPWGLQAASSPSLGSQRRLTLLAGLQAPPFNV